MATSKVKTKNKPYKFNMKKVIFILGFLGLFIFVVLRTLSKAPLLVKNHPYLDENYPAARLMGPAP